jgi:VWFA-related protein
MSRLPAVALLSLALTAGALPLAAQGGATGAPAAEPAPGAAEAQTPPEPPVEQFFESIDVNLVNVDVYVTDKKGNRVRGLGKADFELREDGKPMAITNFYAVEEGEPVAGEPAPAAAPGAAPSAPPAPEASGMPEDQRLHLVIYVDNWNIKPFNRNRVFTGIREMLRSRLTRGDRVMLMTYDREPHVRRPFTSDPVTIASALFEIERLSAQGIQQESERREVLRDIQDARDDTAALIRARSYADSVFNDLSFALDSLKNTVASLAGLPGRKAILYVSDGLPMVAGEDVFQAVQEKFSSASVSMLEARNYDASRRFKELIASANANRITFYTLDAAGLRVSSSVSAENRTADISGQTDSVHWSNIQSSLRMLADETGGVAILNSNEPTKALERVAGDLRNFYSLGYTPAHSGDGRYHEVDVRVKGRKDLEVRAREGYRDKTVDSRMSDGVTSALFYDVESNPLGIVVVPGEQTRRDDGHYLVSIKVRIPIGKLVLVEQGEMHRARLRVFVAAMDEHGNLSEVQQSAVPVEVPGAELATALGKEWVYTVSLVMRSGPQRLAVGVRDELGQTSAFAIRTLNVGAG